MVVSTRLKVRRTFQSRKRKKRKRDSRLTFFGAQPRLLTRWREPIERMEGEPPYGINSVIPQAGFRRGIPVKWPVTTIIDFGMTFS